MSIKNHSSYKIYKVQETSTEDGFKCIQEFENEELRREMWFKKENGLLSSYNDKPALITYDSAENLRNDFHGSADSKYDDPLKELKIEVWYEDGFRRRNKNDLPTMIIYSEQHKICEIWCNKLGHIDRCKGNGVFLPAIIWYYDGTEKVKDRIWYEDGNEIKIDDE